MAIKLETRTYNRTLDSLTAITYVTASSGTMTAYVPFSATSFNAERSEANVDEQGSMWCEIRGVQKYGLEDNIYLLILKFSKFFIYDQIQSSMRSAIISGTFATQNKSMSFPFEFKISQVACEAMPGALVGDIIFYKLDGSSDVLYNIETRAQWTGGSYCNRVIGATNVSYSKLKVRNCVDLSNFYRNQRKLANVETENCDFSHVTSFNSMFYGCTYLESINVSNWNFSGTTTIASMFSNCTSLSSLTFPVNSLENCRDFSSVFSNCTSISNIDVSGINTSNAITMANMFSNCQSLTNLNVSDFILDKCTNLANMFYRCSSLTTLDLTSWNVSNCTNFSGMFGMCSSLTNIIGGNSNICGASVLNGASQSIDISTTKLDLASIVAIFSGVATVSEGSGVYIKLSKEQWSTANGYFYIAEKKNWRIIQANR